MVEGDAKLRDGCNDQILGCEEMSCLHRDESFIVNERRRRPMYSLFDGSAGLRFGRMTQAASTKPP